MASNRKGTVLISGYGKLPANITSEEVYGTAVVVVIVDLQFGTIVKAECSAVTEITKEFVAGLLVGYNLNDGLNELINRFNTSYYGQAKKAMITSLKMIFAKYEELMSGSGVLET